MTNNLPLKCSADELKKAMGDLEVARMRLSERKPALTYLIYSATYNFTTAVQTSAISQRGVMLLNPHFVLSRKSSRNLQAVIEHELWHWWRKHHERGEELRKINPAITPLDSNMGGDDRINRDLFDAGESFGEDFDPKACLPEQTGSANDLTMEEYTIARFRKRTQQQQQEQQQQQDDDADDSDEQGDEDDSTAQAGGDAGEEQNNEDARGGADDDSGEDGSEDDSDANEDASEGGSSASGDEGEDEGGSGAGQDEAPGGNAPGGGSGNSDKCEGGFGHGSCGGAAGCPTEAEAMLDPDDGKDEEQADLMREQVASAIISEAQAGRGNYSSDILRWAEKLVKPPKVKWQTVLNKLARRAVVDSMGNGTNSYRQPSRKQAGLGYGVGKPLLPGNRRPLPNVQVWADTSGSMGSTQLSEMLTETESILKTVPGRVTFGACDARVHAFKPVKTLAEIVPLMKGGGGTDFRPLFAQAMKAKEKPDIIVVLTDGDATIPPKAPDKTTVIWVLMGRYRVKTMPWGKVIDTEVQ